MSGLTAKAIQEAIERMKEPPVHQEILCGNLEELCRAVKRRTGVRVIRTSPDTAVWGAVDVRVSPNLPQDRAALLENGEVKTIIDLRGPDK